MTLPRGRQRFGRTSHTPAAALLSYWYGLSGACADTLLALYLAGPRGCRVSELMEMLETKGQHYVVKVYVCHLRMGLRQAFDGADMVETARGPERGGPHASWTNTRYHLRPAAMADVREALEMAHEELADALGLTKRQTA